MKRLDGKQTPERSTCVHDEEDLTILHLKDLATNSYKDKLQPGCSIDMDFGNAIVGLRMPVPNHWWNECVGDHLHMGRIVGFNPRAEKR